MKYLLYILLVFFANKTFAQFNVGVNGVMLNPQGEFSHSMDENAFGVSINGSYKINETPFSIGADLGWSRYGSVSKTETLIWPVSVEVTTNNDIVFGHLFGRFELDLGFLKPYAEMLMGFNYLFTNTEIEDIEDYGEDNIASVTHFEDAALNYGLNTGIMVKVLEEGNDNDTFKKLFFDFKIGYSLGDKAEYLKEGDLIRGDNNKIIIRKTKSGIDYLSYQIGLVFQF